MKLLEQLAATARLRRLAQNTIDVYSLWVRQFLTFSAGRYKSWMRPEELGTGDVEAFLNDLVIRRRLSASSQNQALNALVFLYTHVLENTIPQDHLGKFVLLRSRRPQRLPTVLSVDEVRRVIDAVDPTHMSRLMIELMYGTGMRVSEVCTLRVRDIDLGRAQIIVRAAKGDRDRIVMLPACLRERLVEQLDRMEQRWRADVARGGGYAPVPDALLHKRPRAGRELPWQFVFPSLVIRRDETGRGTRWHTDPSRLDRIVYDASQRAGVKKRVTCHTFRHCFATHVLEAGYDIRQVQGLLGHASLKTTMIYTHVMNKPGISVRSPLDRFGELSTGRLGAPPTDAAHPALVAVV
jgi:integron integrase